MLWYSFRVSRSIDTDFLPGVAISTTGEEHRMGFLETSVVGWSAALPAGSPVFVTVDGTADTAARVAEVLAGTSAQVNRIGQPHDKDRVRDGRVGVAANKNTGLELLMAAGVLDLFLSDDDTTPRNPDALKLHQNLSSPHSMVCWGKSRMDTTHKGETAAWTWPRGVMLYQHRVIVDSVGGMVEDFGPGGHEHAEWSMRIHNGGWTPANFPSPLEYWRKGGMGAEDYWLPQDMRRRGESLPAHQKRKQALTTVRRRKGDWTKIGALMESLEGSTQFFPYQACENGREPSTLFTTSQGA